VVARLTVRLVSLLLAGIGVLALGAGVAHADGESIVGTLLTNDRAPVAGVTITVTSDSGFSKSGVTQTDGKFAIPVPKVGNYSVELDESTLPNGIAAPVTNPIQTEVLAGTDRPVLFVLGVRARNVESKWHQLPQYVADGIRIGLIIALCAVGLSLIYGTTGLTNFAHGEVITFGALSTYFFNVNVGMGLIPAAVLGVIATGIFGAVLDRGLWKPLRRRGTGLIAMMIVSIGLALAVRNVYLIIFGGSPRPFNEYVGEPGIDFGPITLTPADLAGAGICIVVLVLSGLALLKTRMGKATRAVADNPALAASTGIDVERVILVVWVAGSALAGLGGILLALSQQVAFNGGQLVLLLVFAAVTLGGLGTAFGALVGSVIIGLITQVSVWLGMPAELQNVSALAVLIIVLMVRPQGILGRRNRIG